MPLPGAKRLPNGQWKLTQNFLNFIHSFIQASEDDKDKTLLKYYAKTIVFDLAYSKQVYRGNQAGNNDVKRLFL